MTGGQGEGHGRYTLRPATADDDDFLWRLHVAAMREYVERTWGWDEGAQAAIFRERSDPANSRIVIVAGRDAGVLVVERRPDRIFLSRIQLLPGAQGRGVGTAIVGDLLAEAGREGVPVALRVLRVNPARRLYERLGFAVTEETPTHYLLRALPASGAGAAAGGGKGVAG